MSYNEWISVKESMPGLEKKVEIKFIDNEKENATLKEHIGGIGFFDDSHYSLLPFRLKQITHWRPIPEKRPDFSKLRNGDLIVIEYSERRESYTFFVSGFDKSHLNGMLGDHLSGGEYNFYVEDIKKITRINIENHTFEEI